MNEGERSLCARQWIVCSTLIAVAILANWWPMLFSGDGMDIDAFRRHVQPLNLSYIPELISPLWGWAYRPAFLLYFSAALRVNHADPLVLHSISLLLHLAVMVLASLLVRRLVGSDRLALFSAALFAAGTWNSQAIFWICSTTTLFASAAYLVALHCWLSWRRSGKMTYSI